MSRYMIGGTKNATSVQSVLLVLGAAASPRIAEIDEFTLGSNATAASTAFLWYIQACSTAGTGTTLTPRPCGPANSAAATTVVKDTVTADPTLTAGAFYGQIPLNQNATYRWTQLPGSGIFIGGTASAGLMIGLSAATTTLFGATVGFKEL